MQHQSALRIGQQRPSANPAHRVQQRACPATSSISAAPAPAWQHRWTSLGLPCRHLQQQTARHGRAAAPPPPASTTAAASPAAYPPPTPGSNQPQSELHAGSGPPFLHPRVKAWVDWWYIQSPQSNGEDASQPASLKPLLKRIWVGAIIISARTLLGAVCHRLLLGAAGSCWHGHKFYQDRGG